MKIMRLFIRHNLYSLEANGIAERKEYDLKGYDECNISKFKRTIELLRGRGRET